MPIVYIPSIQPIRDLLYIVTVFCFNGLFRGSDFEMFCRSLQGSRTGRRGSSWGGNGRGRGRRPEGRDWGLVQTQMCEATDFIWGMGFGVVRDMLAASENFLVINLGQRVVSDGTSSWTYRGWLLLIWYDGGCVFFGLLVWWCINEHSVWQACVKRIEEDENGQKHCTGQYFDYWGCIDQCVSLSLVFIHFCFDA